MMRYIKTLIKLYLAAKVANDCLDHPLLWLIIMKAS